MATPSTGAISFGDLSVEILQASSTSQRSITSASERLGYSTTATISMSDLRKAYGATITCGQYSSKFVSLTGYSAAIGGGFGSMDANTVQGTRKISDAIKNILVTNGINYIALVDTGTPAETGFDGNNTSRVATSNTLRTLLNCDVGTIRIDANTANLFPTGTTVTLGIKWNI